jgi:DNA helicase-2/ATP-dependent DNA helicase PcrA
MLVLAVAGGGKTKCLCTRVAKMIHDDIPASAILAVTFTNKAAREMKERASKMLGIDPTDLQFGTFHGTCARMLRNHPAYSGFTILDHADSVKMVGAIIKEFGVGGVKADAAFAAMNTWRNDGLNPEDVPSPVPGSNTFDIFRIYVEYRRLCAKSNAVDFADLILHVVRMLKTDPTFREGYRRRWRYLLVDEYQDTNPVQLEFIKQIVSDNNDVMVVGDDCQAIHEWRGARVRNILDFPSQFPGTVVVKMQENFRSRDTILRAANNVIRNNMVRTDKALVCTRGAGPPVEIHAYESEFEEANGVGNIIVRGVAAKEFAYGDVAILYRINALSQNVEKAFRRKGIPYRIVGTQSFFERVEIKDALAYVRLAANPSSDMDFSRVVNTPARGFGNGAMHKLADFAHEDGTSLFDAARKHHGNFTGKAGAGLRAFMVLYGVGIVEPSKKPRGAMKDEPPAKGRDNTAVSQTPLATAMRLLEESGYIAHLRADDNDERIENVKELLNIFKRHEEEGEFDNLSEFLAALMLSEAHVEDESCEDPTRGRVTLMSMHASKGLEFPCVIGVGLGEGTMPFVKALAEGRIEEERRLMYVTITRARERLWLTFPVVKHLYFGPVKQGPCRFIEEMRPVAMTVVPHIRRDSLMKELRASAPNLIS